MSLRYKTMGKINSMYQFQLKREGEVLLAVIMCTLQTRGDIFLLTLTGAIENRFSLILISQIRTHLNHIRSESKPGSVLITTAETKFFSNGLDLAWSQSKGPSEYPHRFRQLGVQFQLLLADLMSLPLPTIAAVTGHAAAAGFLFAISHDYILMRKDRGFLYISELDNGIIFRDELITILKAKLMDLLKSKLGPPRNLREMMLQGMKLKAEEGVERGIIDSAHDNAEETVEAAMNLGNKLGARKWNGELYVQIRKSLFVDLLPDFELSEEVVLAWPF